jgi:hypothetical protein
MSGTAVITAGGADAAAVAKVRRFRRVRPKTEHRPLRDMPMFRNIDGGDSACAGRDA